MPERATCTTTHNSAGPASTKRLGVWGYNVHRRNGRDWLVWLFVTELQQRLTAYVRLPESAACAPENGCTFYGEGARHVRLERMHVCKRQHSRLPIMNSWSRRWDAAKQTEVWTFVSEQQQVFTAEVMQSNCEHRTLLGEQTEGWVHTRSEGV